MKLFVHKDIREGHMWPDAVVSWGSVEAYPLHLRSRYFQLKLPTFVFDQRWSLRTRMWEYGFKWFVYGRITFRSEPFYNRTTTYTYVRNPRYYKRGVYK